MSDHTPYNSRIEMVTHGVYFQHQNNGKDFHPHQSLLVAVGEKLPSQREKANSEDLFAVAAS